jgi:hypothetical protein
MREEIDCVEGVEGAKRLKRLSCSQCWQKKNKKAVDTMGTSVPSRLLKAPFLFSYRQTHLQGLIH